MLVIEVCECENYAYSIPAVPMVARSSVVTTGRFGAVTVVMGLGMQGCVFVQRPCRYHSWALSADGIAAAHHWAGAGQELQAVAEAAACP